ncbi:unnamed protein product [Rotaria sordida]|uniref:Uncharacterized protein n=1 Tax=Rotaria sordida TaxID=392033 RepID=A0A819GST0_9BILA|nr:unnamed protein product [Rotaria sordida]CAF3887407.1 unnamed protein product [Rotaria sordida]
MYNWTLDNRTSNFNLSRKIIHAIDAESNFANDIQNTKFIETWAKYDDIEIYTNLDLVSDIFRNPFIRNNKIIDMFLLHVPLEQLTLHSLFPFLFEILFQPSLEVANALQPILQAIENGYMFTCIHLRMGQNPSNPLDDRFQDRSSAVKDIIDFLNRTNLRKMRNTRVFIASDSEQVVSNIASQFPNQTITIPGPILHIDRPADANFIAILSGLTSRMLSGWAADLTNTDRFLCKLRAFVLNVARPVAFWLILLAAIDRWLLSSPNARLRQISTLKNAQRDEDSHFDDFHNSNDDSSVEDTLTIDKCMVWDTDMNVDALVSWNK